MHQSDQSQKDQPVYNPPGARGEDTFLSTCLSERKVLRVPSYTFHDGFSTYHYLMDEVLPIKLKPIRLDSDSVVTRFYKACLGWVRYKPLLLYVTQRDEYENKIVGIRSALQKTLPAMSQYFKRDEFMSILKEFERYHLQVKVHYRQFTDTQEVWAKVMDYLVTAAEEPMEKSC